MVPPHHATLCLDPRLPSHTLESSHVTHHPTPATTMLEIACFNASSAIRAAKAGADRIELCADYAAGGVTPPLSTLHSIRDELQKSHKGFEKEETNTVPINVMIRSRGGDFNYSAVEFSQMRSSMEMFKDSKTVDGFVFGVLDEEKRIDVARNRELVEVARPLPCTFHRAIDEVDDLGTAVSTIIDLGFHSILTSGGARSATDGADKVSKLRKQYGERISLVLGGGIRSTNVVDLKKKTEVEWVHSAAITGPDEDVDENEVRGLVTLLCDK